MSLLSLLTPCQKYLTCGSSLQHDDRISLSFTCKHLWHVLHSNIFLEDKADLKQLENFRYLSQPDVIVLRTQDLTWDAKKDWPITDKKSLLVVIHLSSPGCNETLLAVAAKSAQLQSDASTQTSHIPTNLIHTLTATRHHQLYDVTLRHNNLDAETMVQLTARHMQCLVSLDLCDVSLDTAAMSWLIKGSFPMLKELNLSHNRLAKEAMSHLVQGKWLLLEWLDLGSTGVSAAAISELRHAAWPQLNDLDLRSNKLKADAIAALVTAHFPKLSTLDLRDNQLDAAAAECLIKGTWPCMQSLQLSANCMDKVAMKHLARGQWPHLKSLTLHGHCIGTSGMSYLVNSNWNELSALKADRNAVSADISTLLRLHSIPTLYGKGKHVTVSRERRSVSKHIIWPSLKEVKMVNNQRGKYLTYTCADVDWVWLAIALGAIFDFVVIWRLVSDFLGSHR